MTRPGLLVLLFFLPMITAAQESEKCSMTGRQWVIHTTTKDKIGHEVTDWEVTCRVANGDEAIWENKIPLAHPCTFDEGIKAIKVFLKTRAPQIYREWKKAHP